MMDQNATTTSESYNFHERLMTAIAQRDKYIEQANEQYARAQAAEARVRKLERWIVSVAIGERLIGELDDGVIGSCHFSDKEIHEDMQP